MVFSNNLLLGVAGQGPVGPTPFDSTLIGNSVWLDGSADFLSAELGAKTRTKAVIGTWIQKTGFSTTDATIFSKKGTAQFAIRMQDQSAKAGKISIFDYDGSANQYEAESTSMLLRDNGWYHIMISIDTTAIAGNRLRYYINGIDQTSTLTVTTDYTASDNPSITGGSGEPTQWGVGYAGNNQFNPCYLTQSFMLDDDSIQNGDVSVTDILDPFTLGTNGSQFTPKSDAAIAALASTAGGDSFCLDFANSSDLGNDISSNNNDFTPTSMTSTNQSTNTPSLVYPKISNIGTPSGDTAANYTMGKGSNRMVYSGSNQTYKGLISTQLIQPDDSPIYWEYYLESGSVGGASGGRTSVGLCVPHFNAGNGNGFAGAGGNNPSNLRGVIYDNGSQGSTTASTLIGVGDVQNLAYEPSTGKIWFGVNGTWNNGSEAASTTLNPSGHDYQATVQDYVFFIAAARSTDIGVINFGDNPTMSGNITAGGNADGNGHGNFKYAVPSGFLAPNSDNLTEPSYQGIDYFTPTLYEGNGTGQRVGEFVPFTDAYTVTNSVLFDDGDARSLQLNPSDSATSSTVAAFSLWTKRANLGTDQRPLTVHVDGNNYFSIYYNTSDQLDFTINQAGSTILQRVTARTFKDTSAWHNIVVIINQGNGTQADRVKVFYDGVQIPNTSAGFGTNTCTLDGSSALNFLNDSSSVFDIGGGRFSQHYDGYIAEAVFLDGADSGNKIDATPFGQVDTSTNRWVAKDPGSYTFGNMGYYLEFKVASGTGSGAGTDTSGESNNFTETGSGWATSDQFVGNPSANYATLNRIIPPTPSHSTGGNATMSQGNLKWDVDASTNANSSFQTTSLAFQIQDGKWYYELESVDSAGGNLLTGLVDMQNFQAAGSFISDAVDGQIAYGIGGSSTTTDFVTIDGTTLSGTSSPFNGADDIDNGDVLGVYIEKSKDTYNFWFSRNGTMLVRNTSQTPMLTYSRSAPMCVFVRSTNGTTKECALNFGQQMVFDGGATTASAATGGRWKHVPTNTAYKALNVDNLDNTASKLTAWAWIKNRDATDNHMLFDRVRGVGNDWHSNDAAAEVFNANTVQRFLQRGVQVSSDVEVNTANESYVLWQWLVGDSATTGSTTSPAGSNPSTTIVADHGGFSIGTYTGTGAGATVGHGLSSTPELILIKGQNYAVECLVWSEYTKSTTRAGDGFGFLSSTNAFFDNGPNSYFADTDPNATVITMNGSTFNTSAKTYNLICFKSVPGVCKVGSYIGNGDNDGPYISVGFLPRYVLVRSTSGTRNWNILDTARNSFNIASPSVLLANTTAVDTAAQVGAFDILSDGFKPRDTALNTNGSGETYLYMAMADIGGNGTLPPVYGR
jgi:hypothetical protein